MNEVRCVVIEVGPLAWGDEPTPRAKPGDKVLVSKFAGKILTGIRDGRKYRMVNGRDIYCLLDGEEEYNLLDAANYA